MGRLKPSHFPTTGAHISAKALRAEAVDPERLPPKFSFHHLNSGYCITQCTSEEKVSFVDKMYRLSQLTWAQLRQAPKHGLGYEKIDRDSIRPSIPIGITEDVKFIAFRFHQLAPMVGYRSGDGTFHVIWFDRSFRLYDHG
jgi:hypothetical protein